MTDPRLSETVDTLEVAKLLDISPQAVRAQRTRKAGRWASFPEPLRLVSGRPVWRREDVERWKDGR